MPRYYFHCMDVSRIADPQGLVLPDDAAAQQAAVKFAADVLNEEPGFLWDKGHWRVEVTDDRNVLLFTVITLAVEAPRDIVTLSAQLLVDGFLPDSTQET